MMRIFIILLLLVIPKLMFSQFNELVEIIVKTGDADNIKIDTLKTVIVKEEKGLYTALNPRDYAKQMTIPKRIVESVTPIESMESNNLFLGASIIIVNNSNTFEENFKAVGRQLLTNGFELGTKDMDFGFIRTKPRISKSTNLILGSVLYLYEFTIGDGYIEMSSRGNMSELISDRQLISDILDMDLITFYEGLKGSTFIEPWEGLKKFAKNLEHTKITYKAVSIK